VWDVEGRAAPQFGVMIMKLSDILNKCCFIFPLEFKAAEAIEGGFIDERYGVEILEFSRSQFMKFIALGFLKVKAKDLDTPVLGAISPLKIEQYEIDQVIEAALSVRKDVANFTDHQIIDKFVSRAKRSNKNNLPFWISI
jgi:hypothetical protein